ncbi:hypothetical protein MesoLj131c_70530 (plasmid) [Mesorhizobium sp. 131-3-5]|nr:hypothetical protein MesoLj131c_70530 [Mesorhizobium sp. 131-3-5]
MGRPTVADHGGHIISPIEGGRHIADQPRHNILPTRCQVSTLELHDYGDQKTQNSTPKNRTHNSEAGFM